MPLYLSIPLPGPFQYTKRIGRRHGARGPFWTQAWFWWTGAFVLYATGVLLWSECLLIYWVFLYSIKGIRWAAQWIRAVAIVSLAEAVRTRRQDKIHAQRDTEDW